MKFFWAEANTPEELEAVREMLNQVSGSTVKTAKSRSEINHQNYERRKAKQSEQSEIQTIQTENEAKESTKENIFILNNIPEDIYNLDSNFQELDNNNNSEERKEKEIDKEKEKKKAERRQKREERKFGKNAYGKFQNVFLTDEELDKLKRQFPDWENRIETMSLGIASKGYSYKSHYAALLKWAQKDYSSPVSQPKRTYTFAEVGEMMERGEL